MTTTKKDYDFLKIQPICPSKHIIKNVPTCCTCGKSSRREVSVVFAASTPNPNKTTPLLHVFFQEDEGACSLAQPSWQAVLQNHTPLTIISPFHKAQSLIRHNYLKFPVLLCFPWQQYGIIASASSSTGTWCYKALLNLSRSLFLLVWCNTVQWLSS